MNQLSEVLLESASRTLAGATGESGHSRTRGAGAWAGAPEISMDWTDVKLTATVAQKIMVHYTYYVFQFFFLKRSFLFEIHQRGGLVGGEEQMIVKEM